MRAREGRYLVSSKGIRNLTLQAEVCVGSYLFMSTWRCPPTSNPSLQDRSQQSFLLLLIFQSPVPALPHPTPSWPPSASQSIPEAAERRRQRRTVEPPLFSPRSMSDAGWQHPTSQLPTKRDCAEDQSTSLGTESS